ncbi:MAG: hypothetical protein KF832_08400 [Caldilineaceae bacterium]|nr:hypothetical protein [Caldilineaceae bacterium]
MRLFFAVWLLLAPFFTSGRVATAAPLPPIAIAAPAPVTTLTNSAAGLTITWQFAPTGLARGNAEARLAQQQATLQQMPQLIVGDYTLPMQLETVILPPQAVVTPLLTALVSEPWSLSLPASTPMSPPLALTESLGPPAFRETHALPTTPLFLLREGRLRGVRLGVIAISPLYLEAGVTKIAHQLQAVIPGATPLSSLSTPLLALTHRSREPVALQPPPRGPINPAAAQPGWKLQVRAAGIQRLLGTALLAAGFPPALSLAALQLSYQGTTLPLEVRDADGLLDATTEVRFYARPAAYSQLVGDRWNATDSYWLTQSRDGAPLRMATRSALPNAAPLRQQAYARGVWEENTLYESTMTGIDDDHWFGAKMEVEAATATDAVYAPVETLVLSPTLPLAQGSGELALFTLTGSARSIAAHTLQVQVGSASQSLTWQSQQFYENWQHTFTTTTTAAQVRLALVAGLDPSLLRIDKLFWQQPVQLDFGGRGAEFSGVPGQWRYQLTNLPLYRTFYDITEPAAPVILQIPSGTSVQFEDGPLAHTYLATGAGTLHTPTIIPHAPVDWSQTSGADAIYLAPAWLQNALQPLVEHRRQQGYQVVVVDPVTIYDAWSYGQVSPVAIRDFLRYAVSHWNPAPIAVTLVGDATFDPRNYLGMQDGTANMDVVPAYLAPIDPWIREAPCEGCFAQLDGEHPLDSAYDPSFLLDIALGRLSVQDEAQLKTVVDKILTYETSPQRDRAAPWHQTALYVADNYYQSNGTTDRAGDFAAQFDLLIAGDPARGIAAEQPTQIITRRLYYDPRANGTAQPWREPNPQTARLRTIAEINRGPALVTYSGHGNHFLWATTEPDQEPPYLFGANDVFELTNLEQPVILLEMTCFTAQFPYLSPTGYTIDERFLRHTNGGAVAVWGSAGLTVAVGHDLLQQGFHRQLWQSPPLQAPIGELVAAGYTQLFAATTCCQDTRYVYLLLGDPLMPALIWAPQNLYLPLITQP